MRPVTDRLKISREKLAFLVDSTAAPIAGLALISTIGATATQMRCDDEPALSEFASASTIAVIELNDGEMTAEIVEIEPGR